jgi:hypothetical protein
MFNRKNLIVTITLFIILAAGVLMAAEGGNAKFAIVRPLFVAGTEIKVGQYDVKWEAGSQDTAVIFTPVGKSEGIKVQGKFEEVAKKFENNSMAIGKDAAGRDAIKQLQFSGRNFRIVFE